ncbi:MAG TPA: hypothetical protein VMM12_08520 [Longimicrobiales bacterium]|nr:hypothetical protein [Longimicrobiales bacterium]
MALGADRRQVARAVFSRAASHVGYGVLAGGAVIPLLMAAITRILDEPGSLWPPVPVAGAILALYMTAMLAVCMLACVVPLRRALRVQPTEALAADA